MLLLYMLLGVFVGGVLCSLYNVALNFKVHSLVKLTVYS